MGLGFPVPGSTGCRGTSQRSRGDLSILFLLCVSHPSKSSGYRLPGDRLFSGTYFIVVGDRRQDREIMLNPQGGAGSGEV